MATPSRGAPVRRGSEDVPASGRPHRAPSAAGRCRACGLGRRGGRRDRPRLRPDDREARHAWPHTGRRRSIASRTRSPKRRSRASRRTSRSSAGSSPIRWSGQALRPRRFLTDYPPLTAPFLLLRPAAPFRELWRLNLQAPPPAPPPDLDVESHRPRAVEGVTTVTAPMPGTVIRVEVEPETQCARANRSSSSRR